MKTKNLLVAALLSSTIFLSSCASFGLAMLFTNLTLPSEMIAAPMDANAKPNKKGEVTATNILGLVYTGDAGIEAAMKAGNITRLHHVDSKYEVVLGIFAKRTTIAYGE